MKNKKLPIIIGACVLGAALIALAAALLFPAGQAYVKNVPDTATGLLTADYFSLFSADGAGFSFLYPEERNAVWNDADGAYIYCGDTAGAPYVLVARHDKPDMTPERYFKSCDEMMLESFGSVKSTPINEARVANKTLYLVWYMCDGLVIDRYVELYDKYFIEYTSISDAEGALDTETYYAISTLRINEGAYAGAFSDSITTHSLGDIGLAIDIPDMLETRELTIGFFCANDDAIMLAVLITQDDGGKAIYNRQDFIDRAAEAPEFVAGLLGADEATFTEGQERTENGKSVCCYPMSMRVGEEGYTGELRLANAAETGCWLICTAVRNDSVNRETISEILTECASSADFH